MAPQNKTICDAHAGMAENVTWLRDRQETFEELIRNNTSEISESNNRITALEIQSKSGFEAISSQLHEYEKQNASMMKTMMDTINNASRRKTWTPKTVIALFSTIFGSGGVGYAIAAALIGKVIK